MISENGLAVNVLPHIHKLSIDALWQHDKIASYIPLIYEMFIPKIQLELTDDQIRKLGDISGDTAMVIFGSLVLPFIFYQFSLVAFIAGFIGALVLTLTSIILWK
jgi:hypothetical protein